jgi:hypothetical protein
VRRGDLQILHRILEIRGGFGALIQHFYSRELLFSEPARVSWTDPDLRRLPALT